jgi:hypothetical protein
MIGSLTLLWHGSLVTASLDADGVWHFPEQALREVLSRSFPADLYPTPADQLYAAAERLAGTVTMAAEEPS